MFKISYIVDDKRLPDMLRASAGHVYSLEVVPVTNAEPVATPKSHHKLLPAPAPKVKEVASGSRNFIKELGWKVGHQFHGKDLAKALPSIGLAKVSNWYVTMNEVKAGRVKRVGLGLYEVISNV